MQRETEQRRRRWERAETQRRKNDEARRYINEALRNRWTEYLSHPNVKDSLNYRVGISLKQRRDTELDTVRPDDDAIEVRVKPRPIPLKDAALFAPYYYLTEDETRKLAIRIVNRLNKEIFGNRARRTRRGRKKQVRPRTPQRLTALICEHSRDTRRHLHCLFAKPADVSEATFKRALRTAMADEPFVYRRIHIERIENLAASILYDTNAKKSLTNDPILYIYPQLNTPTHVQGDSNADTSETETPDQHDFNPPHR